MGTTITLDAVKTLNTIRNLCATYAPEIAPENVTTEAFSDFAVNIFDSRIFLSLRDFGSGRSTTDAAQLLNGQVEAELVPQIKTLFPEAWYVELSLIGFTVYHMVFNIESIKNGEE